MKTFQPSEWYNFWTFSFWEKSKYKNWYGNKHWQRKGETQFPGTASQPKLSLLNPVTEITLGRLLGYEMCVSNIYCSIFRHFISTNFERRIDLVTWLIEMLKRKFLFTLEASLSWKALSILKESSQSKGDVMVATREWEDECKVKCCLQSAALPVSGEQLPSTLEKEIWNQTSVCALRPPCLLWGERTIWSKTAKVKSSKTSYFIAMATPPWWKVEKQ